MKKRNILYIVITIICIISIILAVYAQIFEKKVVNESKVNQIVNEINDDPTIDNPRDTLEEFNKLFTNTLNTQGNSINNVKKIEGLEANDIVYTLSSRDENTKYSVNVKLPIINIESEVVDKLNSATQLDFANKAEEIYGGVEKYTVYNVEYAAFVNDNILSVVIKATIKEDSSPQVIKIHSYNYDMLNDKKLDLNDILADRNIKTSDVNKKIEEQVKEASKNAEILANATGQIIYKRNLNDKMYATDYANEFILGKKGQLYIIFAYGNNSITPTSEIDIIKI